MNDLCNYCSSNDSDSDTQELSRVATAMRLFKLKFSRVLAKSILTRSSLSSFCNPLDHQLHFVFGRLSYLGNSGSIPVYR
jgi:hypothetical protein